MSRVLRFASEADLPEHLRRRVPDPQARRSVDSRATLPKKEKQQQTGVRARGVAKNSGGMNRTEAAYAEHLTLRQQSGDIAWFAFEAMKLRLADRTFYTPDFAVMLTDGTIEQHEVKGFWEDDARVKIKVAAALYPFRFIAVQKQKAGWKFEEFTKEDARP